MVVDERETLRTDRLGELVCVPAKGIDVADRSWGTSITQ
jgi:hypothetical protein